MHIFTIIEIAEKSLFVIGEAGAVARRN